MNRGIRGTSHSISSASVSAEPSVRTTNDITSSSVCSDGTATAADSMTSGCWLTMPSTSNDEMFSPRRRMASFMRSQK